MKINVLFKNMSNVTNSKKIIKMNIERLMIAFFQRRGILREWGEFLEVKSFAIELQLKYFFILCWKSDGPIKFIL